MNQLTEGQKLLISITISALQNNEDELREQCRSFLESYSFQPVYEALLQLHLFAGYPCSLTSLSILQSEFQKLYPTTSIIDLIDYEDFDYHIYKSRGLRTCEMVYTNTYAPMMSKIKEFSPQLQEWMLIDGYGKTLSRTGLSFQDREILVVSVLLVQGWKKQLYSHIRGSKNVGVPKEMLEELLEFGNEFFSPSIRQYAQEVITNLYE